MICAGILHLVNAKRKTTERRRRIERRDNRLRLAVAGYSGCVFGGEYQGERNRRISGAVGVAGVPAGRKSFPALATDLEHV